MLRATRATRVRAAASGEGRSGSTAPVASGPPVCGSKRTPDVRFEPVVPVTGEAWRERPEANTPRDGAPTVSRSTPSCTSARSDASALRPGRGGSSRGAALPATTRATRPPRRTPTRATTSATPSATSLFRRPCVPKAIEAETSSTIHVVTARSGTCRRTCGSPVRALAAGSRRRTSSPGSYGRSCESSMPSPAPGVRCSPGSAPAVRRRSLCSRRAMTAGGSRPGPWRPAGMTRVELKTPRPAARGRRARPVRARGRGSRRVRRRRRARRRTARAGGAGRRARGRGCRRR